MVQINGETTSGLVTSQHSTITGNAIAMDMQPLPGEIQLESLKQRAADAREEYRPILSSVYKEFLPTLKNIITENWGALEADQEFKENYPDLTTLEAVFTKLDSLAVADGFPKDVASIKEVQALLQDIEGVLYIKSRDARNQDNANLNEQKYWEAGADYVSYFSRLLLPHYIGIDNLASGKAFSSRKGYGYSLKPESLAKLSDDRTHWSLGEKQGYYIQTYNDLLDQYKSAKSQFSSQ